MFHMKPSIIKRQSTAHVPNLLQRHKKSSSYTPIIILVENYGYTVYDTLHISVNIVSFIVLYYKKAFIYKDIFMI